MSVYYHRFEVRWSDIDANRHLANFSYVQYCAHARMGFLKQHHIGLSQLNRWGIAPVILHENYSFFKEILSDQEVYVTAEIGGLSEDGGIYQFIHRFYLSDGTHCATSEATGVWIDAMLRKRTSPPDDVLRSFLKFKTEKTKTLSQETIKALPFRPENIDPQIFK